MVFFASSRMRRSCSMSCSRMSRSWAVCAALRIIRSCMATLRLDSAFLRSRCASMTSSFSFRSVCSLDILPHMWLYTFFAVWASLICFMVSVYCFTMALRMSSVLKDSAAPTLCDWSSMRMASRSRVSSASRFSASMCTWSYCVLTSERMRRTSSTAVSSVLVKASSVLSTSLRKSEFFVPMEAFSLREAVRPRAESEPSLGNSVADMPPGRLGPQAPNAAGWWLPRTRRGG
mmetsp:Transcript_57871/g.181738  ORF Transcript_57871/g.181738 Transcript_57871/m.181738 type:complete len:232 (+) Transcript_57871:1009-1704(+)